jgi:hypothetical protein
LLADGSRRIDFADDLEWSDGSIIPHASQTLNSTNHIRPAEGGPFPLPS